MEERIYDNFRKIRFCLYNTTYQQWFWFQLGTGNDLICGLVQASKEVNITFSVDAVLCHIHHYIPKSWQHCICNKITKTRLKPISCEMNLWTFSSCVTWYDLAWQANNVANAWHQIGLKPQKIGWCWKYRRVQWTWKTSIYLSIPSYFYLI